jgi:hypothetical protein
MTETGHCGKPAVTHVIWDAEMRNGLVCHEHAQEAAARWFPIGMHPYEMVCSIGGARWIPDEDRCVVDDEDLGLSVVADLVLAVPHTGRTVDPPPSVESTP